jgi:hypothetical protein
VQALWRFLLKLHPEALCYGRAWLAKGKVDFRMAKGRQALLAPEFTILGFLHGK